MTDKNVRQIWAEGELHTVRDHTLSRQEIMTVYGPAVMLGEKVEPAKHNVDAFVVRLRKDNIILGLSRKQWWASEPAPTPNTPAPTPNTKVSKARTPVTPEQVFDFLSTYIAREGYAPAFREIRDGLSISSTSVVKLRLDKLQQMGLITYRRRTARSIRIMKGE